MADGKHILFFVDHKWRDLLSSVYIKLLLEARGYRVTLARNGFERFILPVVQPDAVVFNHVYEDRRVRLLKGFEGSGMAVVILPTENIPVLDKVKGLFAGSMTDMSVVDLLFVWNDSVAETVREMKTFDPQRTTVIGVPRFDVYREPLNSLMAPSEGFLLKYGLRPGLPVVTMTTNFTMSGFAFKNQDFLRKDTRGLKTDQLGYDQGLALADYRSRQMAIDAFSMLPGDFPGVNFIIKPHPSEDHAPYYGLMRDLKRGPDGGRVAAVFTEYIWDVLSATDVLVERSCLTGIEAWIMGKPTIELRLNPEEWYHSPEIAGGSDEANDYAGLKGLIGHYLGGGAASPGKLKKRQETLGRWCGPIDGGASLRFVDRLDGFLRARPGAKKRFSLRRLKTYAVYLAFIYPDYVPLDLKLYSNRRKRIDKLGRTDKYFRAGDVRRWEERIKPLLNGPEGAA